MAFLKGDIPTASWLHYQLSIRRSSKNYQNASKRAHPATLAATLLLGFYEVWSSNHERWCTHMIGARQLIRETPFSEMSRQILAIHQQRQRWAEMQVQSPFGALMTQLDHTNHELADVDLDLVGRLSGKPVAFIDPVGWETKPRRCTDRDLENYELMMDLYWWFCKMDVYQSTLGATKLL